MLEFNITPQTSNEQPQVTIPVPEFLELMGEDGIRAMAKRHYDAIRTSDINHKFPQDDEGFDLATKNSAEFFIQICGGPAYFNENRGAPMMAARHSPFKINQNARRIWLESYILVLKDLEVDEGLKQSFWNYLDIFSIWMMNTVED